jgi:hypothetical protein
MAMDGQHLTETRSFSIGRADGHKRMVKVVRVPGAEITYQLWHDDLGVFFLFFHQELNGLSGEDQRSLGRILVDKGGNWIYEGNQLSISEQEEMAACILPKEPTPITVDVDQEQFEKYLFELLN